MIMRGEEGPALHLIVHRLDHCPGDREAVVSRGAAADLIEDDEALRRGLREDRGGLDHLDHEGGAAARQIVRSADAAEQAIDDPEPGAGGGDKGAGLGKDGDQRGLAEERRLAAHVWAGNQPQPVVRSEREIVGNEAVAAVLERGLDHGVPAATDLEARFVGELRPGPSAFGGAMGMACRDVDPRNGVRRGGDLRSGGDGQSAELLGVRGFRSKGAASGLDHLCGFLMQLGRVESHHAGQSLAVGEAAIGRHEAVRVLCGDLDMIAQHGVVPDLQGRDTRRVAITAFERRDRAAAVGCRIAQRVERRIIAVRDVAALGRVDRRRGNERAGELVDQRAMSAELRKQAFEERGAIRLRLELTLKRDRSTQPVAEERKVARAAPAGG